MKFQKLTIHNIASIEDAVIDFDCEPLLSSEVFLITGKTGAGKSTILDAICLALYADTPRLDTTRMQGDTKEGDRAVKINDPRQLMRRNTGEAFVKLTFTGSNAIHYEASWSVARARKKPNGNYQHKSWQLKNLDTGLALLKDDEIKAEIGAAIGLDFKQFCRTTLLAQGEFTRFLNSRDDEKAEILEKITGVDIYSKIGAKVYEITSGKERDWNKAQERVKDVKILSEDELSCLREKIASIETQSNEIKAEKDGTLLKREWLAKNFELSKNVEKTCQELEDVLSRKESEDLKSKETLLREWNFTQDARRWLKQVNDAESGIKAQKSDLDNLSGKFALLLGGYNLALQKAQGLQSDIKTLEETLSAVEEKSAVYASAQTISGHLSTVVRSRDSIAEQSGIILREKKLQGENLIPAFEKVREEEKNAGIAYEEEKSVVEKKWNEVCGLNLAGLRLKKDETQHLLSEIEKARTFMDFLLQAVEQHKADGEKLENHRSEIDKMRTRLGEMEAPLHDAEIKMETCQRNLESQKDTVDKFAKTLRQRLHMGDVCPVCRQKIDTELPHEEDLSLLVKGLQDAFDAASRNYKELSKEKTDLEARIAVEEKAYDGNSKAFDENKNVIKARENALNQCQLCGIDRVDGTTLSSLNDLKTKTEEYLKTLITEILDGEKKEENVNKLRQALEKRRTLLESLSKAVQMAENAVNKSKDRIANAEDLIRRENKLLEEATQKVKELLSDTKWNVDWIDSPAEFSKGLLYEAKLYNDNLQKKQRLTGSLETLQTENRNVSTVIKVILETLPDWQSVGASQVNRVNAPSVDANNFLRQVTSVITMLKSTEEALRTNKSRLDEFLAGNTAISMEKLLALNECTPERISDVDKELKDIGKEEVEKRTLAQNAQSEFDKHQNSKPELSEEDTIDLLDEKIRNCESSLSAMSESKGSILKDLSNDEQNKKQLGNLIEEADRKKEEYNKWDRMNQLIGDATGNKFRKIAQSYVLANLIHSANSYMKTLCDRYTLKVVPGSFVITLEDAYQGFASRAASTISGGESFLVSLSLALALSDIGQTLSVDTLFIDEGFGTLSGEPLQCAINTLRSLHTKAGRHVGIISHVDELQERIPVQIQVNQEGNNSSSTVKIVP